MKWSSPSLSAAETGRLVVRGIAHDENEPYAIIGTQIVKKGERILGAAVIRINQDSVEFEMNGRRWIQKVEDVKSNQ
jgi:type II secretory pathway component PulC